MKKQQMMVLAALGSAALLLGAFGFQHIGGYPPCKMCLWQRWPHAVAIVLGLVAALLPSRIIALCGAAATATTATIGAYHVGVEQKWLKGPNSCTSNSTSELSVNDLLNQILQAPIVRCDEIAWQFLGVSMAGWNAIVALGLTFIWLLAARK